MMPEEADRIVQRLAAECDGHEGQRLLDGASLTGRLGHGEDVTLSDLHRRAHELLWATPCDLAGVTRAVASYQQAVLTATARWGEVPR